MDSSRQSLQTNGKLFIWIIGRKWKIAIQNDSASSILIKILQFIEIIVA